jgi:rod shape determining protein RodA
MKHHTESLTKSAPRSLSDEWSLLIVAILISSLGVLNLYSSTYNPSLEQTGIYFWKQILWTSIGWVLALICWRIQSFWWERLTPLFYVGTLILLAIVLGTGKSAGGAQRWLLLGPINIQPSEISKIVTVMMLARYLERDWHVQGLTLNQLWKPALWITLPFFFILLQPDLGTALIVFLTSVTMIFFGGMHRKAFLFFLSSGMGAAFVGWHFLLKEYQKERILNFLDPARDPLGAGYHAIQSQIAIGSGGLTGKGFLEGTQSQLHFLPECHTDFAVAVWGEEWGFFGILFLLGLYLYLAYLGLEIARQARDRFGLFLNLGVISLFLWQIVINMAMTIGIAPVVGIPLPLFSYGGSSMIVLFAALGMMLSVSRRRSLF